MFVAEFKFHIHYMDKSIGPHFVITEFGCFHHNVTEQGRSSTFGAPDKDSQKDPPTAFTATLF